MKKIIALVLALAMVFSLTTVAMAEDAFGTTMIRIDITRHSNNTSGDVSGYIAYAIDQATAKTLMGSSTTVAYADVFSWLGADYKTNKAALIASAVQLSTPFSSSEIDVTLRNDTITQAAAAVTNEQALAVVFYNDGDKEYYKVFEQDLHSTGYSTIYFFNDAAGHSNVSEWSTGYAVDDPTTPDFDFEKLLPVALGVGVVGGVTQIGLNHIIRNFSRPGLTRFAQLFRLPQLHLTRVF